MNRNRSDRCPGALRPWPADDGLLVRLRLPGGQLNTMSLARLGAVAGRHGDGRVHVTGRSNLQLRAMPAAPGTDELREDVIAEIEATGLLPSRSHDLVRNIMASPRSGVASGRVDIRPTVTALDAGLCANAQLAQLPGRFLFVLDDGTGDVADRDCDLGLVALGPEYGQLRIGSSYGPIVALNEVADRLISLAAQFLVVRGSGAHAAWHVDELSTAARRELPPPQPPARDLPARNPPLPFGPVEGGHHLPVPPTGMDRSTIAGLVEASPHVVVTPWRGVFIPLEIS